MGRRRLARVATSDDDEDSPPPMSPNKEEKGRHLRKKKRLNLIYEDKEEEELKRGRKKKGKAKEEEEELVESADDKEETAEDAKPIGDVIKAAGRGRRWRNHYAAFEYHGLCYELEDSVLLFPEERSKMPYVAIIKEVTQSKDGAVMLNGQRFYRPEEVEKKEGGNWQSRDARELFYSFHRDEVPAESVMHKCVVHFIPLHKQIPHRKQHPGFIVQKVYDTDLCRLFKLTDRDYEDSKQHELDILVQKTLSRLGDVPEIETEDTPADQEDRSRHKRMLRKKSISFLDVPRDVEETTKAGQPRNGETPRSVSSNASEFYTILSNFEALTGETQRDKWLEKLLQGVRFICTPIGNEQGGDKGKSVAHGSGQAGYSSSKTGDAKLVWPDSAVRAVFVLEKSVHDNLYADFGKYNQKMRQLDYNLKNNESLSRRLLNGELEPATILNMQPNELRVGLTADEMPIREPEKSEPMQTTKARCKRCMERNVGIVGIIQVSRGERYQLLCNACGNQWYASREEASVSIDGPSASTRVGTTPLATAKFEDVEKTKESKKCASEVLKKTT